MTTAEILDRTFRLYKSNFLLFAGLALLPAILALLMHLAGLATRYGVLDSRPTPVATLRFFVFEGLLIFVAYIIGGGLAAGATACAVYNVNLERPATIRDGYRRVFRIWRRTLGVVLYIALVVTFVVGLCFFGILLGIVIPVVIYGGRTAGGEWGALLIFLGSMLGAFLLWLYMNARYALAIPAVLLEQTTIRAAIKRSRLLGKGSIGRIMIIVVLTLVISLAATYILSIPSWLVSFGSRGRAVLLPQVLSYAAQFISTTVAGPVGTIALVLVYIDQRVRKEALDLQVMMESLPGDRTESVVQESR